MKRFGFIILTTLLIVSCFSCQKVEKAAEYSFITDAESSESESETDETLQKGREEAVPLLGTTRSAFEASGMIYRLLQNENG